MLRATWLMGLLAVGLASQAAAQSSCGCQTRVVNGSGTGNQRLTTLLQGSTVCATAAGGDKWQEYHQGTSGAANNLIDYKKGPTDKVDPSKAVGKWTINTDNTVTYDYGGGGVYSYTVWHSGSGSGNPIAPFCFCSTGGTRNITGATIPTGQVSCGF